MKGTQALRESAQGSSQNYTSTCPNFVCQLRSVHVKCRWFFIDVTIQWRGRREIKNILINLHMNYSASMFVIIFRQVDKRLIIVFLKSNLAKFCTFNVHPKVLRLLLINSEFWDSFSGNIATECYYHQWRCYLLYIPTTGYTEMIELRAILVTTNTKYDYPQSPSTNAPSSKSIRLSTLVCITQYTSVIPLFEMI